MKYEDYVQNLKISFVCIGKPTLLCLLSRARVIAPEPQPNSRHLAGLFTGHIRSDAMETRFSVSGLGMKTDGDIFKVSPQKSHSPKMYWSGILCNLRRVFSCRFSYSSFVSLRFFNRFKYKI